MVAADETQRGQTNPLGDANLFSLPSYSYTTEAALLMLRVWAAGAASDADAGEVVRLHVMGYPRAAKREQQATGTDAQRQQGMGELIADISVVCGGYVVADINPVTQEADSGIRYYECNAYTEHYFKSNGIFVPSSESGETGYGVTGVDMKQQVVITSGNWALSYKGAATGTLADTISNSDLKTALEGLSTIGSGNISSVVENPDKTYLITFDKDLGNQNLDMLVASSGTGITITIGTEGVSGRNVTFDIDLGGYQEIAIDVREIDGTGNATKILLALKEVT